MQPSSPLNPSSPPSARPPRGARWPPLVLGFLLALAFVSPALAEDGIYVVQDGDTIYGIASAVGMDVDELLALNQLDNPDSLQIGQQLKIRQGGAYAARAGRMLSSEAGFSGAARFNQSGANAGAKADSSSAAPELLVPAQLSERYSASAHQGRPQEAPKPEFVWPCYGNITTYFGEAGNYWIGGRHPGLDLAGRQGEAVAAAADGLVLEADWDYGYGRYVKLLHAADFVTLYGHLSQVFVEPGDLVKAGQTIGAIGSTGISTGPHLHFEMRQGGVKVDPLSYLP